MLGDELTDMLHTHGSNQVLIDISKGKFPTGCRRRWYFAPPQKESGAAGNSTAGPLHSEEPRVLLQQPLFVHFLRESLDGRTHELRLIELLELITLWRQLPTIERCQRLDHAVRAVEEQFERAMRSASAGLGPASRKGPSSGMRGRGPGREIGAGPLAGPMDSAGDGISGGGGGFAGGGLEHEPSSPGQLGPEGAALLAGLLDKSMATRLGAGGAHEVTGHPFFATIDWRALRAGELPPPLEPKEDTINAGSILEAGGHMGIGTETKDPYEKVALGAAHFDKFAEWQWRNEHRMQEEVIRSILAEGPRDAPGALSKLGDCCGACYSWCCDVGIKAD